jgi:protein gp37
MSTKIEWATKVWNPVTGCTKGCKYCYARRFALRLQNHPNFEVKYKYRDGFKPTFHYANLNEPRSWKKPQMVFVVSMGDLFDPSFTIEHIWPILYEMVINKKHTFLILTKQPQRMLKIITELVAYNKLDRLHDNIWCGVSVTNQAEADELIPILLQVPAAVRFVSIEPMLGPVDFDSLNRIYNVDGKKVLVTWYNEGISWVICGGQTGPGSEPMHPDWVRSLRDQCLAADVPFFFKGWGAWQPWQPEHTEDRRVWNIFRGNAPHTKTGRGVPKCRSIDGIEYNNFPATI